MRKTILSLITVLLLACNSNNKLNGTFNKLNENDRGSYITNSKGLISNVTFSDKYCRFEAYGTTMSGQYKIDGKYVYIDAGQEFGTMTMEIIDSNTLEGEGWISGTFKK
jgi:hypothetical protein